MKIAMIANPEKIKASKVVKDLLKSFPSSPQQTFFLDQSLAKAVHREDLYVSDEKMSQDADVLVVLGGDGTLLHGVKRVHRKGLPVLGVNLGGMGFLTEFSPEDFIRTFGDVLKKKYKIDERMTLDVHLIHGDKRGPSYEALNDAVITKGALSRMLSLDVFVKDDYLTTYKSDGLIVATPTGSTAHSLSGGGPVVHPRCQVMILTPICPHTLSNRPLVISDREVIRVQLTSDSEKVGLTLDGQIGFELRKGDWIEVCKGKRTIPLIRMNDRYFDVLREKLGWRGSEGLVD